MQAATEAKILEQIHLHREDFRMFRTELLGGAEQDKPNGRIPLLEVASASHEKRIRRIEHFLAMLVGAAGLLKVLSWSAESIYHIVGIFH